MMAGHRTTAMIVAFAAQNSLHRFQEAIRGTIDNFPVARARWLMRAAVFPFGARRRPAPDWLGHKIVGCAWSRAKSAIG